MKNLTLLGLGATAALAIATPSQAAVIELGLAIDASGSISAANFNLQRQAYINALSDSTLLPRDGSIAIGVYRFSGSTTTIFSMAEITNANFASLITALTNMTQPGGGTNIGSAIDTARIDIFGNGIASERQIIDVSTDGVGTLGSSVPNALAAGIDQINCIGIGVGANCTNVVGGAGSFSLQADSFDDFEAALRTKLRREITGAIPEPSTWAMLILGFGAVGATMRRRQRQTARVSFA